mgnify:CR=1 FL=1|jgi:hypothetical protein
MNSEQKVDSGLSSLTDGKPHVLRSTLPKSHTKFIIDGGAGLGQYITTGTQVLLQLSFCDGTHEQLSLLDDIIQKLGIEPEDFNRKRRNDEKARQLVEGQDEKYSFE